MLGNLWKKASDKDVKIVQISKKGGIFVALWDSFGSIIPSNSHDILGKRVILQKKTTFNSSLIWKS